MGTTDQDTALAEPSASGQQAEQRNCLELQLHTDEAVWMRQIGHLKDWCSETSSVKLGIPARVATPLAASSLRLLWLFQNLQQLDITFNSIRSRIDQPVLVACAELLNLTSLSLRGGHLPRRGLDLGSLTSLRRLRALSVRPHSDEELDGLEDEHLAGAARLTGLTSLSLRASENVTDEGIVALTALTGLTQLALVPMGLCVTREGLSALSAAMPSLEALSVGLHECRQVAALKGMEERPRRQPQTATATATGASSSSSGAGCGGGGASARSSPSPAALPAISLVLNSPEVSAGGFFSTLTLVLRPRLVSLRMATVESTDGSFLLALGTLVHLTELKMGVSVPEGGQPYACSLASLASLGQLRTLEFAVTQELGLPLSAKMVSHLAHSWPHLRSLSLSAMAKPEVAPAALQALHRFAALSALSLFAPLDYYASDDDASAITLPVSLRLLPPGLTHLVLECAHLREVLPSEGQQQQQQQQQQDGANALSAGAERAVPSLTRVETVGLAGCSGAGGGPTRGSLLPHLEQLELNSCHVSDEHLAELFSGATGMRHLELTDVRGLTDSALAPLTRLTRLEHLVVRLSGGGAAAAAARCSGVSHRSLATLRNAATLRHLEWSLPEPLGAAAAEVALARGGLLGSCLGGLQELFLDVAPELRGAAEAGAASEGGPGEDGGRDGGGGSWRERLQRALPLCTVAERPGIVVYDLWNDRTVQVVGP